MQEINQCISEHAKNHPAALPQDFVKLLYQSAFGGGHMIENEQLALDRLKAELAGMCKEQMLQPAVEQLCGEYCRVNLSVCEKISAELLNKIFVKSGKEITEESKQLFEENLRSFVRLCENENSAFGFTAQQLRDYLIEYRKLNYRPISHSEVYRAAYKPAYRVVLSEHAKFLPLYAAVEKQLRESGAVTIAIDGNCGAGKSTGAARMAEIFDCNVFHADDFFLPQEKRTAERMAEIGGNMERERLQGEILEKLKSGREFCYRPFDCSSMSPGEEIAVKPKKINIIEGSYSMHPQLRRYYDISVFITVAPQEQERRIAQRNGEKMLQRFKKEWIPRENAYFEQMKVIDACSFVF